MFLIVELDYGLVSEGGLYAQKEQLESLERMYADADLDVGLGNFILKLFLLYK
jgi:hypothetical protein